MFHSSMKDTVCTRDDTPTEKDAMTHQQLEWRMQFTFFVNKNPVFPFRTIIIVSSSTIDKFSSPQTTTTTTTGFDEVCYEETKVTDQTVYHQRFDYPMCGDEETVCVIGHLYR